MFGIVPIALSVLGFFHVLHSLLIWIILLELVLHIRAVKKIKECFRIIRENMIYKLDDHPLMIGIAETETSKEPVSFGCFVLKVVADREFLPFAFVH